MNWEATAERPRRADPRAPDAERAVRRVGARAHRPSACTADREDDRRGRHDAAARRDRHRGHDHALVQAGRRARSTLDEPLFEVSTDKVDSEVPAPAAGVADRDPRARGRDRRGRRAPRGDLGDGRRRAPRRAPRRRARAPPAEPRPQPRRRRPKPPRRPPPRRTAAAARAASDRRAPAPAPAPPAPAPAAARRRLRAGVVTSPIVRRLIAEHGLDPTQITRHRRGRPHHPQRRARPRRATAPPRRPRRRPRLRPPRPGAAHPRAPAAERAVRHGDEVVPFDNIRRRTAEHMVRSKATSAHVYTSVRGRLRAGRAGPARAPGASGRQRGGLLAHVPAVHRARVLRRRARLPARERERRRRLARRAPRRATSASRSTSTSRA